LKQKRLAGDKTLKNQYDR